jgi:DNA-binding transcriptional ArsR family regulator
MVKHVPNQRAALDQVFRALADGTRRDMVERLVRGPATVGELAKPTTMSLPAILQHLRVLADAGLVRTEKHGRVRTCRIEPAGLRAAEGWLGQQRTAWEHRLDALDELFTENPHDDEGATS